MRAIVLTRYGSPDVLQIKELEKPVPQDNEVLVQVYAASVNASDWHAMRGKPIRTPRGGLRAPTYHRVGADLAGRVEAVDGAVTQFQVGDEVFGVRRGAFAEYICVPEDGVITRKPPNLTLEEAAAVSVAAITALQVLRDKGGDSIRTADLDSRRVRRGGDVCRADRQGVRGEGDEETPPRRPQGLSAGRKVRQARDGVGEHGARLSCCGTTDVRQLASGPHLGASESKALRCPHAMLSIVDIPEEVAE
jgi:hypothetical protein